MSRTPNFETIVMSSILLEAYFREHSINVTIVPIGSQMAEISVKNGPIVIKKSYGFDFGGDFLQLCSSDRRSVLSSPGCFLFK